MFHNKRYGTSALVLLSLVMPSWVVDANIPLALKVEEVQRVKQLTNYCGPACLASVLNHFGLKTDQEVIGKAVYDKASGATNGADMLLYAREQGLSAYSWNSNINDVKKKLALGLPVIVLQQNSLADRSGHYRVITGYDDEKAIFTVMDPYYDDITSLTYSKCERLWRTMGYWALVMVPVDKDTFRQELDVRNPVVHMDLSTAKLKKGAVDDALAEAKIALNMEPDNSYAQTLVNRCERAMGAGANGKPVERQITKQDEIQAEQPVEKQEETQVDQPAEKPEEPQVAEPDAAPDQPQVQEQGETQQ